MLGRCREKNSMCWGPQLLLALTVDPPDPLLHRLTVSDTAYMVSGALWLGQCHRKMLSWQDGSRGSEHWQGSCWWLVPWWHLVTDSLGGRPLDCGTF